MGPDAFQTRPRLKLTVGYLRARCFAFLIGWREGCTFGGFLGVRVYRVQGLGLRACLGCMVGFGGLKLTFLDPCCSSLALGLGVRAVKVSTARRFAGSLY